MEVRQRYTKQSRINDNSSTVQQLAILLIILLGLCYVVRGGQPARQDQIRDKSKSTQFSERAPYRESMTILRSKRAGPTSSFFPVSTMFAGTRSAASYAVDYGYDQMDQTIQLYSFVRKFSVQSFRYPTTLGPIVSYKRRYGYRHGPYYGYGVYMDVPPFFGRGDVRNGLGIDPNADIMAAAALRDGSLTAGYVLPAMGRAGKR